MENSFGIKKENGLSSDYSLANTLASEASHCRGEKVRRQTCTTFGRTCEPLARQACRQAVHLLSRGPHKLRLWGAAELRFCERVSDGGKARRGQATIEFLLTLVISLLIIVVIVMPNYENANNSTLDVSNIAKLRASAEKVANAVNYAAVSGNGTKQTIQVLVPESRTTVPFGCVHPFGGKPGGIRLTYDPLSENPITACQVDDDNPANPGLCNKLVATAIDFTCFASGTPATSFSQGSYTFVVRKDTASSCANSVCVEATKTG